MLVSVQENREQSLAFLSHIATAGHATMAAARHVTTHQGDGID
jgi:hypothetical protein